MIRSVKSVISDYQSQGLLNARAAYHAVGDLTYGVKSIVLSAVHEYTLDCCAYVNNEIDRFVNNYGDWPETRTEENIVRTAAENAVSLAESDWSIRGAVMRAHHDYAVFKVETYIRECLRLRIMDILSKDQEFKRRLSVKAEKYYGKSRVSVEAHLEGILSNLRPANIGQQTDEDIVYAIKQFYAFQKTNCAIWRGH